MRNLSSIIEHNYTDCLYYYSENDCFPPSVGKSLSMTISLTDNHIEVPVFAIHTLIKALQLNTEAIVVTLNNIDRNTPYKALASSIRYALDSKYDSARLVRITPDGEEEAYYGTYGAIFNKDYIPVMMLTWEMEKMFSEDGASFKYKLTQPVLRIAPEVFHKSNAVERFIVNKVIPETLALNVEWPSGECRTAFYRHNYTEIPPDIKAIIEFCPFSIKTVDIPSISTTNKDLLSIALDNLDELIQ